MTNRTATLAVIVLAILALLPQTIPACRFIAFGIVEGDWLNDWGCDHGWLASLFAFVADCLEGRVTVDYPYEDTLPHILSELAYIISSQVKG